MSQDRLKTAARAISGLDPMVPYRYLYRAQVVSQSASNLDQVDVRPDDPSVPEMAGVPLRHGIPGVQVQVRPGCHVVVGWANGEPNAPFAALWEAGADVLQLIVDATAIKLGGTSAIQHVVLGEVFMANLAAALTTILADLTVVFPLVGITSVPTSTPTISAMLSAIGVATYLSPKVTAG